MFELYHLSGRLKVQRNFVPLRQLTDNMAESDSCFLKEESLDDLDNSHPV